jgi:hypothetical protein
MGRVLTFGNSIFDYERNGWSVFIVVDDNGEPVRVEASRQHVEEVFGVAWMDKAGRKRAIDKAVERVRDQIQYSSGVGPDGHRVFRLG